MRRRRRPPRHSATPSAAPNTLHRFGHPVDERRVRDVDTEFLEMAITLATGASGSWTDRPTTDTYKPTERPTDRLSRNGPQQPTDRLKANQPTKRYPKPAGRSLATQPAEAWPLNLPESGQSTDRGVRPAWLNAVDDEMRKENDDDDSSRQSSSINLRIYPSDEALFGHRPSSGQRVIFIPSRTTHLPAALYKYIFQ